MVVVKTSLTEVFVLCYTTKDRLLTADIFKVDVRDIASVKNAMHGVDFIFHAAALKQVPSCEFFPLEALAFVQNELNGWRK